MQNEKYDFSVKGFAIYIGLVGATAASVITLYGYANGFDFLGERLRGASMAMTAAFNTQPVQQPMQQQFIQQQPFYQGQGQMMYQPAPYAAQPQAMQQQAQAAGQFLCPQHGPVGTPTLDATGIPRCPLDGQPMQFHGATAPLR
nr:hypothetical protein [Desulfobulbaceae bacterium]